MEARKVAWRGGAWVATSLVCLGSLLAVVAKPTHPHRTAPVQPRLVPLPAETVAGQRSAVQGTRGDASEALLEARHAGVDGERTDSP